VMTYIVFGYGCRITRLSEKERIVEKKFVDVKWNLKLASGFSLAPGRLAG